MEKQKKLKAVIYYTDDPKDNGIAYMVDGYTWSPDLIVLSYDGLVEVIPTRTIFRAVFEADKKTEGAKK